MILIHMHQQVVKGVDILQACSKIEISFIVSHLTTLLFLPGDIILRQGEDSSQMYFINKGKVDISKMLYHSKKDYLSKYTNKSQQ